MPRFDEITKKAIDHNDIKLLSRLINKGCLDQFDKEGRYNPLFYAIDIGNTFIASYLIKNGAELIIEDAFSINPFQRAVYSCNPEIALLILEFSDYYRFPFAMWAGIELSNIEIIDIGITAGGLDYFDKTGLLMALSVANIYTPLLHAVDKGNKVIISYLLDKGCRLDLKADFSDGPIHLACKRGDLGIVKLLVEHGININQLGEEDFTPLMYAIMFGRHDIIIYLTIMGADCNRIRNEFGYTAKEYAQKKGLIPVVVKGRRCD